MLFKTENRDWIPETVQRPTGWKRIMLFVLSEKVASLKVLTRKKIKIFKLKGRRDRCLARQISMFLAVNRVVISSSITKPRAG